MESKRLASTQSGENLTQSPSHAEISKLLAQLRGDLNHVVKVTRILERVADKRLGRHARRRAKSKPLPSNE